MKSAQQSMGKASEKLSEQKPGEAEEEQEEALEDLEDAFQQLEEEIEQMKQEIQEQSGQQVKKIECKDLRREYEESAAKKRHAARASGRGKAKPQLDIKNPKKAASP